MTELTNFISTVGFPIGMCLVIMYYWNVQFTSKMDDLSNAVSQLNIAVVRLVEKVGGDSDGNTNP